MNEPIINGIDVSEEIRYCYICSKLGLDFKTRKFYCGLSNRNDELPEILSCENFSSNSYIKRLQEENEELRKYQYTQEYLQSEIEKRQKALEEIKKWTTNHNPCDIKADINCTKEDCFNCLNYDIKKITKIINEVLK